MRHLASVLTRATVVAAAAAAATSLMFATPAFAHVTVHPETMPAGSGDIELTFRVPNERDNANTVGLQVFFPSNIPLLTVNVLPIPGWIGKVTTQTPSKPIQSADGPVNQVVTDITWTATGGGIAPGQYQDFDISAGQAPLQPGAVTFKTLQTYSSGEVVRWIQVATNQNANPDTPAPVLTLTSPTPTKVVTATISSSSSHQLALAALVVASIGLVGVIMLFVRMGRRPDRSAVTSSEPSGPISK